MKRRELLRLGLTGAAWIGARPLAGFAGPAAGRAAITPAAQPAGFDPAFASVAELQAAMTRGEATAVSLAERYLDRVDQIDRAGPALNAVIEVNPDALALAAALDAERAGGRLRGPLHGVPVMLKDNIDTGDRMTTTAGSLALEGSIAPHDSFVATRLRDAGAVILAKTNLSEWANFRSNHSSSGWSGRGGQTRNPHALDRNPSGSSSGSAVAVSADLCPVAVGTETDGSIISPASANGLVGIKPTVGLVSRSGIVPIAHSQDTAGPMARTVADAAALLGALVGTDPGDPATATSEGHAFADYSRFLDPDGLRGARLGVARNYFGRHPGVDLVMERAIETMRGLGAEIVDDASIPTASDIGDRELQVLLYEFKADLDAYLATRAASVEVRSLADLIAFNERERARELPYFGQDVLIEAQTKGPLSDEAYRTALVTSRRLARDEGIDAVMQQHALDAIVAPSGGPAWPTDLVNGDHFTVGSSTPAAVAGYPSVTVPAGDIFGLPVGVSFCASAYAEPTLIRLAYAFEQAAGARRAPAFRPTALGE